jgi:hypothetical protein
MEAPFRAIFQLKAEAIMIENVLLYCATNYLNLELWSLNKIQKQKLLWDFKAIAEQSQARFAISLFERLSTAKIRAQELLAAYTV